MPPLSPEDPQQQPIFTPQEHTTAGAPPSDHDPASPQPPPPFFYTQEQEEDLEMVLPSVEEHDDPIAQSAPFLLPFQPSVAMPPFAQQPAQGVPEAAGTPRSPAAAPPTGNRRRGPFSPRNLLLLSVVLLTILGVTVSLLVQSTYAPRSTQGNSPQVQKTRRTAASPTHGTAIPTKTPMTAVSPAGSIPSTQRLQQLGWTQAGLTRADASEALRTGSTFTDREMSYDYRNTGTPTHHSGTFTGATFLLTSGGQVRFTEQDKRAINNSLYDQVQTAHLIQQVVDAQSSLMHFQSVLVQGQLHQFAWVTISFLLFQSYLDPTTGQRVETFALRPTTGQPQVHQMTVILLRVPPQNQGTNAPMGGTGWLVNTYALDTTTLPAIATAPTL